MSVRHVALVILAIPSHAVDDEPVVGDSVLERLSCEGIGGHAIEKGLRIFRERLGRPI